MTSAVPRALPAIAPALFGDVEAPDMVIVDLRAPCGEVDPFDVIRGIVDRGQAACLYDREGQVSDCVIAKVDDAVFVVTAAGRATFSDLAAALRHGLSRPLMVCAPPDRKMRRRLRRGLDRLKG